jgi:hypothetical protein
VELAIESHDELLEELYNSVQSEIVQKLNLKLDLVWDNFKPKATREVT